MNAIAYCQPFVPPEWIAAHGLRPLWLRLDGGAGKRGQSPFVRSTLRAVPANGDCPLFPAHRGVCPVAAAIVEAAEGGLPAAAIVLTTTCDQVRYAAAVIEQWGKLPVFLMHVPRTWQTAASRLYYGDELKRLGKFLIACGGKPPDEETLRRMMLQYDHARSQPRPMQSVPLLGASRAVMAGSGKHCFCEAVAHTPANTVALALVGGPLFESDGKLLEVIENAGGRIVLDATEGGERTLPAPLDPDRLQANPFEELVRVYFDAIPDVFRRPNDRLYDWLRPRIVERGVRGVIVRRHVWCDLWHAELPRLRQETSLPLLDLDIAANDHGALAAVAGRVEAFVEMLR